MLYTYPLSLNFIKRERILVPFIETISPGLRPNLQVAYEFYPGVLHIKVLIVFSSFEILASFFIIYPPSLTIYGLL